MNSLFQLEIPKRKSHCQKGQEPFTPGMEYYSVLADGENGIERFDYCTTCWTIPQSQTYWQGRLPTKQDTAAIQNNKIQKALHLLKEMISTKDSNEGEVFILALFLARARKLFLRKEFQEGTYHYHLYEIAHLDEFLTIKNITLNETEILQIQQSLAVKLHE